MFHVDDNDLLPFCEIISKDTQRIIIGDLMKRRLHFVTHQPLCFGRNQHDYLKIFKPLGFKKTYSVDCLYPVYGENLTLLVLDKHG
jgi:hypothetical protein